MAERVTNSTVHNVVQNILLLQAQIDILTGFVASATASALAGTPSLPTGWAWVVDGSGTLNIMAPNGTLVPIVSHS